VFGNVGLTPLSTRTCFGRQRRACTAQILKRSCSAPRGYRRPALGKFVFGNLAGAWAVHLFVSLALFAPCLCVCMFVWLSLLPSSFLFCYFFLGVCLFVSPFRFYFPLLFFVSRSYLCMCLCLCVCVRGAFAVICLCRIVVLGLCRFVCMCDVHRHLLTCLLVARS
jgi:hypothetical protein